MIGRVIDPNIKPCFAVVNRGKQTQAILGPSAFFFDSLIGNEFKIYLPTGYLRMPQNPFLAEAMPTIQIYSTPSVNSKVKIGS